ncbi:sulfurtransferase [Aureibaculum sp. 2210JD6-5]|uniref:sulfurtransferase n=1 Tax=Aureibaculum sp. 2210JD6-5 TaxID=3103957 RepID=UPI002AADAC04|nr:sulfurtransferase [Aureibaculum sp. 2210JD6-5]MDY7393814.1 sulfurtransferase [Aureibaculum sp. 2210JD6-5]
MNIQLQITKPLVSVEWLYKNRLAPNLVILDATIPKVGQKETELSRNDGIENVRFFDIKNVFSNNKAPFPNTLVSPKIFEIEARKLGINKNSAIVVYDQHGIYSSPRAWWLFKTMGHKNIAVLDGGLPAWKNAGYPCEKIKAYKGELGNFKSNYQPSYIYDYRKVLDAISDNNKLILDARSDDRFKGLRPEPRAGLRSGHIPNSKNLPYNKLLNDEKMLPKKDLTRKFDSLITGRKPQIIFSCGSGITACILALGAEVAGYKNLAVYDGSWTEWGSLHELPIEK